MITTLFTTFLTLWKGKNEICPENRVPTNFVKFYSTIHEKVKKNIIYISAFWGIQKSSGTLVKFLLYLQRCMSIPNLTNLIKYLYNKTVMQLSQWRKKNQKPYLLETQIICCSYFSCCVQKIKAINNVKRAVIRQWFTFILQRKKLSWILIFGLAICHSFKMRTTEFICDMEIENQNGPRKKEKWEKSIAHD